MGRKYKEKKKIVPWLLKMTLLAATIKAAVDLYLGWRIVRAFDYLSPASSTLWGWGVAIFLLLFYLFPLSGYLQYVMAGNVDVLTYPKSLIYLFWAGYAFSFQVLVWIVAADVIKLLANANGVNAPIVDQVYGMLVIGVSIIVLLYSGYKMYSDTTQIKTETITYSTEGLSSDLQGLKIAHITDIQADRYTGQQDIADYVEQVNAQKPDLIVITGDLISYGTDYVDLAATELAALEAPRGIYFVVGDHDYWAGTDSVTAPLRQRGIQILEGKNAHIQVGKSTLRLSGLTNVYSRKAPLNEIKKLTHDTTKADLRVMAAHQVSASIIDECIAQNYNMLLAGHTHGGQIRVPVFFKKLSAPDFETKYVRGTYYEGDMLININNGLGFTLAPVRYNAPPTISIIELNEK